MFQKIYLHDFKAPLRRRLELRRVCGPYQWRPAEPNGGRGFYMESGSGLACARHGSCIDLRVVHANEMGDGWGRTWPEAYFCDRFGDGDEMAPIVLRLPKGRGYLAGWTMGAGMCASVGPTIYHDDMAAARAAHREADSAAEAEREYQTAREAGERAREYAEAIRAKRQGLLRLLASRRASGALSPEIVEAIRHDVEEGREAIQGMRDAIRDLRAGDGDPYANDDTLSFHAGDPALMAAFEGE